MAYFAARDQKPAEYCRREVEGADVYVGIIGFRYGTMVPDLSKRSYVELEFETASSVSLPRLIFLLDEKSTSPLPVDQVLDHENGTRQAAFRHRLSTESGLTARFVTTPQELETELYQALIELHESHTSHSEAGSSYQLPPTTGDFVGRADAIAEILRLLSNEDIGSRTAAAPVPVIVGPAGVGKTTLALRVAHQLVRHYPDAQLLIDLHGTDGSAAEPEAVLVEILTKLGVHGATIPSSLDERTLLFRSRLEGRRVLIVFDDASSEAQVRPLLPGCASCGAIVTSRTMLGGLEGARIVKLPMLAADDVLDLLAASVGSDRIVAEPDAARTITDLCGNLPLAVRIVGARLGTRPLWRLGYMASRLSDERNRLDELQAGDLEIRTCFSASYDALDAESRRTFRYLGLTACSEFTTWHVAALLDTTERVADTLLQRLVDSSILDALGEDRAGQPRYRIHTLLRVFAQELLHDNDSDDQKAAALMRFVGAHLALAQRARAVLSPEDARTSIAGSTMRWLPTDRCAFPCTHTQALDWFEASRADLVTIVEHASAIGLAEVAWEVASALPIFLTVRGYWQDMRSVFRSALSANLKATNEVGITQSLHGLALAHAGATEWAEAQTMFEQCLTRYLEQNSDEGILRSLGALAGVAGFRGDLVSGAAHLREQYSRAVVLDARYQAALAKMGLAELHRLRGDYEVAETDLAYCVAYFHQVGETYWEASSLRVLGQVYRRQGRLDEAADILHRCLAIMRSLRDHWVEAYVLRKLAQVYLAMGEGNQAQRCLIQCVRLCNHQNFTDLGRQARDMLAMCISGSE